MGLREPSRQTLGRRVFVRVWALELPRPDCNRAQGNQLPGYVHAEEQAPLAAADHAGAVLVRRILNGPLCRSGDEVEFGDNQ
jgi:hypothetical protein